MSLRAPALLLAALLGTVGLTGCGDQTEDPGSAPGHLTAVRDAVAGHASSVLLPTGRIDLTVGRPVSSVPADRTKDLHAVHAPSGGSLVPVGWSFDQSSAPWGGLLAAGTHEPEVSLVVGDRSYRLGSPYSVGSGGTVATSNDQGYYVAVDGTPGPDQVSLAVEYDGVTQRLDATTGTRETGRAAGLYRLSTDRPGGVACPASGWQASDPTVAVRVDCSIAAVGRTPYYPGAGWAPNGHEWVVVDVPEVRLLRAVASSGGGSTTYRVRSITDHTTLAGARPEDPLEQQSSPREYVAGGVLVFPAVTGATARLRFDLAFDLEPDDVRGGSTAPDTLRLSVQHEVDLHG